MKETGIIMSGEHPKLILDGTKTMSRRTWGLEKVNKNPDDWEFKRLNDGAIALFWRSNIMEEDIALCKCPYGQVGDRLWIEQTWRVSNVTSPMSKGIVTIEFKAGNPNVQLTNNEFAYNEQGIWLPVAYTAIRTRKWQSAMFMPKSTASIWLEITEVGAERLREITYGDCMKEGLDMSDIDYYPGWDVSKFKELWDSLNAKRGYGWDKNNWVFPISFKALSG